MKIKTLALALGCAAALATTSCNSDAPANNYVYTNIVTVKSIGEGGVTLGIREIDDSREYTYTTTQTITGEHFKVGNRIVITYQCTEEDAMASQPIQIYSAMPTVGNGGDMGMTTPEMANNWKSDEIDMNMVWRTGEYINVVFTRYTDLKYEDCYLQADSETINNEYPDVYLVFREKETGSINQSSYAFYVSYSLKSICDKPNVKGITLHFNDPNLNEQFVQINKGTLGDDSGMRPQS